MPIQDGLLTVLANEDLSRLLGEDIKTRTSIHAWPLSRVDKIETATRTYALKTQLSSSSVERQFYRAVNSPLLLSPVLEGEICSCDFLLLPWLDCPSESWEGLSDYGVRARVREVSAATQEFASAPVYFDYSSPALLLDAFHDIKSTLTDGGFSAEEADKLESWLAGDAHICYTGEIGLLHGDLKPENLKGSIVLDWQRPMRAPLILEEELALRLTERNSSGNAAALASFVLSHWYAHAYTRFLPYPFVRSAAIQYARECLERLGELT